MKTKHDHINDPFASVWNDGGMFFDSFQTLIRLERLLNIHAGLNYRVTCSF